jgi:hypothetical protein
MKTSLIPRGAWVLILLFGYFSIPFAQDLPPVQLMKPQAEGGRPLMQALKERSTSRALSPECLSVLRLRRIGHRREGLNRPTGPGKGDEPSAQSVEYPKK